MYCKYCGKQVPDNTFFCPECGRELRKKPSADLTDKPGGHRTAGLALLCLMVVLQLLPILQEFIVYRDYPEILTARKLYYAIQIFCIVLGVLSIIVLALFKKIRLSRVRPSDFAPFLVMTVLSSFVSTAQTQYSSLFFGEIYRLAVNIRSSYIFIFWGSLLVRWLGMALFLTVRSGGWRPGLRAALVTASVLFVLGAAQLVFAAPITRWLIGGELPAYYEASVPLIRLTAIFMPVSYTIYFTFCALWGSHKGGLGAPLVFAVTEGVLRLVSLPLTLGVLNLGVVSIPYSELIGSVFAFILLLVLTAVSKSAKNN